MAAPKKGGGKDESAKRDELQRILAAVSDRRNICLNSVGWMVSYVLNMEGWAVTNCADAGNTSANTAAGKARSRRGLFCTARIFR